jgi:hypothetical protein
MKKIIIGAAIGIVLASAVIVPISNARTQAELEAQRNQIALEQAQTEIEALKAAGAAEKQEETPVETAKPQEAAKVEGTAQGSEALVAETAPEPIAIPSSPAQPTQTETATEYPKEWVENGQKYAYLTAYAEEMGMKTLIYDYAEGESNAVQEDYYDWENDPNGKIPGPFNGNGASGNNN